MLLACSSFAQKDSSRVQLKQIEVKADSSRKKSYPNAVYTEFSNLEIQNSANDDLGTILSRMSSVTLKDYGGVGGLKTISVRGFSATHTGVLIDGLIQENSQTGSINLGNIRSENVGNVGFWIGSPNDRSLPVKANSYASTINITPYESLNDYRKTKVKTSLNYASFNTLEPFFGLNQKYGKSGKNRFGLNFRYLYSEGNYPYTFENGNQILEGERGNSLVRSALGNISGSHQLQKGDLSYRLSYMNENKGLPGAIILYDSTISQQRLANQDFSGQLKYYLEEDIWSALGFFKYSYSQTDYTDPNFLNSTGGIEDQYWVNSYYGGVNFSIKAARRLEFLLGVDETYTTLVSNKNTLSNTWRSDLKAMVGINYLVWRIKIQANGIFTYLTDNNSGVQSFEAIKLNPFISFGIYPIKNSLLHFRVFYKNSLRPPTMNEMYFNQIIKDVQPEIAHQLNIGTTYKITTWKFFEYMTVGFDFYKNFVRNKIVLIPTQNLFIWSVQNVGKVDITGLDFSLSFKTNEKKNFRLFWDLKYSLLLAQDVSDPDSKTYKNQLPYTSKDNFSTLFGIEFFDFGLSWQINYGGPRYALTENIEANELPSFLINDLSLYYNFRFKENKHLLRIKVDVRNILNEQYVMVKSFPMPGINFNVKLVYEFTK